MGSITRSLSNNITTGGVILPAGITNDSVSAVTSFANASGGTLILLSTQTASNSATISFTTGLDSTYDEYQFHFINVNPATLNSVLQYNFTTDGTNFNVTKTTTMFRSFNNESESGVLDYQSSYDLAQSTSDQAITWDVSNDADACTSGILTLFNPSSTTYVKHFIHQSNGMHSNPACFTNFSAGYCNTTSAITGAIFKFSSGNIADGIFKLYGVKKS